MAWKTNAVCAGAASSNPSPGSSPGNRPATLASPRKPFTGGFARARGDACIAVPTRHLPEILQGRAGSGRLCCAPGPVPCSATRPPPRYTGSPTIRVAGSTSAFRQSAAPASAGTYRAWSSTGPGAWRRSGSRPGSCRGPLLRTLSLTWSRARGPLTTPTAGFPAPWGAAWPRLRRWARHSRAARGYAGEPGSPLPCRMRPMASTHRWSATTCTAWSARMACRRRGGKPSAGTAAAPGTWTTRTRTTACASSSTGLPRIRRKAAGATPTGTTRTSSRGRSPSGTAGRTRPSAAAGQRPRSPRSCAAAAGPECCAHAVPAAGPPGRTPTLRRTRAVHQTPTPRRTRAPRRTRPAGRGPFAGHTPVAGHEAAVNQKRVRNARRAVSRLASSGLSPR